MYYSVKHHLITMTTRFMDSLLLGPPFTILSNIILNIKEAIEKIKDAIYRFRKNGQLIN